MRGDGLVYGVGVSRSGNYRISHNYSHTREYTIWKSMLRRCYNSKAQLKCPTYVGCSVSENFKDFQFFAEWANGQVGFQEKGWQLDKDILVKGNKIYSEENCCFVPRAVNQLFTDAKSIRGDWPIGVSVDKRNGKFTAAIHKGGTRAHLGQYNTPAQAHTVYVEAKEQFIKETASLYQDRLDPRVYECLIKWRITND